jgi:ferric-dicitrate binding protein FerR (iron transport regulator)
MATGANPEWVKAYRKAYYFAQDKILARGKARREANPEAARARDAAWREASRQHLRAYKKAWRASRRVKAET